jgi:integrase
MEAIKQAAKRRSSPRYWVEKNGSLYARYQYKDDTGKVREKYQRIPDKRTARTVVERMRQEHESHGVDVLRSDKMTFADLLEKYKEAKIVAAVYADGVKVAGKRSIAPVLTSLSVLAKHFGNKHLRSIKASDLETYKNARLKTPIEIEVNVFKESIDSKTGRKKKVKTKKTVVRQRKISSVNRELETLRSMLNFAIENDWLIKNPFEKKKCIISKASENERDRVLSLTEEFDLLNACVGKRAHLRPVIICALDTAMRRGEMFQMRWKDVNFATGEIFIPQTNTKTEEARTVGMTSRLREELEHLWRFSPQDRNLLVFGLTNTVKTAWKTICELAHIEDFHLHDCRHTATTRMIASGSAHTEVMKITGHKQLKTFLRYLTITPETARKCASKLDMYLALTDSSVEQVSTHVN